MGMEEDAKNLNFEAVVISLIVSAFSFVAALFWRDAIQGLIAEIVPEGQGLAYQFGTAVLVTLIAVVAIYVVTKHLSTVDDRLKSRLRKEKKGKK
jgi:hypothetical protein